MVANQHYSTGLQCATSGVALPKWGLRVVNGTSTEAAEGRLEIQPQASMPWGTVCAEGFMDVSAKVACDEAGFNEGVVATEQVSMGLNLSHEDMGLNYISGVSCTGSEKTLQACKADWFHHCSAANSVHITCTGRRAGTPSGSSSDSSSDSPITGSSSVDGLMSAVVAIVCATLMSM